MYIHQCRSVLIVPVATLVYALIITCVCICEHHYIWVCECAMWSGIMLWWLLPLDIVRLLPTSMLVYLWMYMYQCRSVLIVPVATLVYALIITCVCICEHHYIWVCRELAATAPMPTCSRRSSNRRAAARQPNDHYRSNVSHMNVCCIFVCFLYVLCVFILFFVFVLYCVYVLCLFCIFLDQCV